MLPHCLNRFYWFGVVLVHMGSFSKGPCSFLNRFYWFGVVGLCTLGVN